MEAGKLAVSDAILKKTGKLTQEESGYKKFHAVYGEERIRKQRIVSS